MLRGERCCRRQRLCLLPGPGVRPKRHTVYKRKMRLDCGSGGTRAGRLLTRWIVEADTAKVRHEPHLTVFVHTLATLHFTRVFLEGKLREVPR